MAWGRKLENVRRLVAKPACVGQGFDLAVGQDLDAAGLLKRPPKIADAAEVARAGPVTGALATLRSTASEAVTSPACEIK